eukprot:3264009-Pleurochrysis_carterae.AAC.1
MQLRCLRMARRLPRPSIERARRGAAWPKEWPWRPSVARQNLRWVESGRSWSRKPGASAIS